MIHQAARPRGPKTYFEFFKTWMCLHLSTRLKDPIPELIETFPLSPPHLDQPRSAGSYSRDGVFDVTLSPDGKVQSGHQPAPNLRYHSTVTARRPRPVAKSVRLEHPIDVVLEAVTVALVAEVGKNAGRDFAVFNLVPRANCG